VVGDSPADVGLARSVGARPLHVGPVEFPDPDVTSFVDLAEAVAFILRDGAAATATGAEPTSFPARQYRSASSYGGAYSAELARAMASIDTDLIARAADVLGAAYDRDATVFACGNGGSASIANHLQCDHVRGVRNSTGLTTRVYSLSTNV
jgi:hypothetical protein